MSITEKTRRLLRELTLEEKVALLSGKNVWESRDVPRLQIPSITCSDGPNGVRRQAGKGDHLGLNASLPATCFPTAATIANSWNLELVEEVGAALGEEAKQLGVDVLLGPGLNIKRTPLCGRNFEYYSEDPYLSGKMAAACVRGIQSSGTAACPKHFAVNSQEERRMAINAVIDERTLREIYLTGFEIAIKEGKAKSIMSSYNEINGVYANENEHLLKEILREEWGFNGCVITDWGASNDHISGVKVRSNLEMPAPGADSPLALLKAYSKGTISKEEIDQCTADMLQLVLDLRSQDQTDRGIETQISEVVKKKHHLLAQKAAEESIILLKNDDNILPLKKSCKVAVIGDFAEMPRYQGAGSSCVNATKVDSIHELISQNSCITCVGYERGFERNAGRDYTLEANAIKLAAKADAVLFCCGLDEISESEGLDRKHMKISDNQIFLLEKIAKQNVPIIGILFGGSAIEMPWEKYCKAIIHTYLGGQAGADAVLEILSGNVTPSGKLCETYPFSLEDTPAYHYGSNEERDLQYREGLYVGYRYYDTAGKRVRYPFGYGLSYTHFAYTELQVSQDAVSVQIENVGEYDGAEIVQVYISCKEGKIFRPVKQLKGFAKLFLKVGEKKTVRIPLDDKAFRYWDTVTNQWETETALYQIMVGASSSDIRLSESIKVEGTTQKIPYSKSMLSSYYTGKIENVTDDEFSALMKQKIRIPEDSKVIKELTVNDALCQMKFAKNGFARLVWRIMTHIKDKSEKKGKPNLNLLFIYNMPFRGIAKMTNGAVNMEMANCLVTAVNGHFWKGIGGLIKAFFRNRKDNKKFEEKLKAHQQ